MVGIYVGVRNSPNRVFTALNVLLEAVKTGNKAWGEVDFTIDHTQLYIKLMGPTCLL